jgi:peroxiredoxin
MQEIERSGAQLFYIAAEKRRGLWRPSRFLEKHPISVPFLLDENRSVAKAYGLYHRLGSDAMNIAHPASLVIDRDGIVRYIYRGDDQRDRAPVEDIIQALETLSK